MCLIPGWWFGCHQFFIFPFILGMSNHPNWRSHIFQTGGEKPPTRYVWFFLTQQILTGICVWKQDTGYRDLFRSNPYMIMSCLYRSRVPISYPHKILNTPVVWYQMCVCVKHLKLGLPRRCFENIPGGDWRSRKLSLNGILFSFGMGCKNHGPRMSYFSINISQDFRILIPPNIKCTKKV